MVYVRGNRNQIITRQNRRRGKDILDVVDGTRSETEAVCLAGTRCGVSIREKAGVKLDNYLEKSSISSFRMIPFSVMT